MHAWAGQVHVVHRLVRLDFQAGAGHGLIIAEPLTAAQNLGNKADQEGQDEEKGNNNALPQRCQMRHQCTEDGFTFRHCV